MQSFMLPRFFLVLLLFSSFPIHQWTLAQIPRTLSYQAILTDNAGVPKPDGSYTVRFRLYDAASGGTALWTESQVVQLRNGLFSTSLGSVTPIGPTVTFTRPYWLSIEVPPDPELPSRLPLTASGYSLGPWTMTMPGNTISYDNGNVGIGTASPATKLTVNSAGYGIEHTDGARRLSSYLSGTGGWFGTRSNDPLNFFVNDGAARMTLDIGGRVGIGTTTPASRLTVRTTGGFDLYGIEHTDGTVRLSTFLNVNGGWFGTRTNHPLNFYINDGQPSLAIDALGNIVMTPNGGLGGYGKTTFGTPNGESGMSIHNQNRGDLRFDGSTLKLVAGSGTGPPPSTSGIAITTAGNIGIGTAAPSEKLDVVGNVHVAGHLRTDGHAYVSGNAYVTGHGLQNRDQGGFAKAMVFVSNTGTILRSYNPYGTITARRERTGVYVVDFGFRVDDRFYSVTAQLGPLYGVNANFVAYTANQITVYTQDVASGDLQDTSFMIIVY